MDISPLHPIYPHQYQYAAHSPTHGQRLMQHHRSRKDRDGGGQIGKYRRAGNAEPRQGVTRQEAESPEEVAEEGCECGFLVGLDVHTVAYLCSTCTDTFFPLKPMPKSVILRIPWYSMSV